MKRIALSILLLANPSFVYPMLSPVLIKSYPNKISSIYLPKTYFSSIIKDFELDKFTHHIIKTHAKHQKEGTPFTFSSFLGLPPHATSNETLHAAEKLIVKIPLSHMYIYCICKYFDYFLHQKDTKKEVYNSLFQCYRHVGDPEPYIQLLKMEELMNKLGSFHQLDTETVEPGFDSHTFTYKQEEIDAWSQHISKLKKERKLTLANVLNEPQLNNKQLGIAAEKIINNLHEKAKEHSGEGKHAKEILQMHEILTVIKQLAG